MNTIVFLQMFRLFEVLYMQSHQRQLQKLDEGGESEMDSYLEMPGSTATGTYWDPPGGEACCGGTY